MREIAREKREDEWKRKEFEWKQKVEEQARQEREGIDSSGITAGTHEKGKWGVAHSTSKQSCICSIDSSVPKYDGRVAPEAFLCSLEMCCGECTSGQEDTS